MVEPTGDRLGRLAELAAGEVRSQELWRKHLNVSEVELSHYSNYARNCLAGYHNVAYHNMHHALNVFDFVLDVFHESPKLHRVDVVALALAALCHDYGHPGLNNDFMALYHRHGAHVLSVDEIEWVNAFNATIPEGGGWGAVGRSIGQSGMTTESSTYIAYPGNYDYMKSPILEDAEGKVKVFATGCETSCSSIEESYHAAKALEIARSSEIRDINDLIRGAILATDFGRDYWMRARLLHAQRAGELQRLHKGFLIMLALHTADIGGVASEEFLLWTVGINVEFDRQVTVGSKGVRFPETFNEFFQSQLSWMSGVGVLFKYGFEALGVEDKPFAKSRMELLTRNMDYFRECSKSCGSTQMLSKMENESLVAFRDRVIAQIITVCLASVAHSAKG